MHNQWMDRCKIEMRYLFHQCNEYIKIIEHLNNRRARLENALNAMQEMVYKKPREDSNTMECGNKNQQTEEKSVNKEQEES